MAKNKLFANWTFGLPLPKPFDDPAVAKNSTDTYSKYCSGRKQSTLHAPTLSALLKYAELRNASEAGADTSDMGAIGHQNDKYWTAEYPGSKGVCTVVIAQSTGRLLASVFSAPGMPSSPYLITDKGQTGSALFFCAMPALETDDEFRDAMAEFLDFQKKGFPDLDAACQAAYLLCDNAYRRIENAVTLGQDGLKLNVPTTGNITQLTDTALNNGSYSPTNAIYGDFTVFDVGGAPAGGPAPNVPHPTFVGKYVMSPRILTASEMSLVPNLPAWHVVSPDAVQVCQHIQQTTGTHKPIRNIMLRGPAGTGKTETARAIAAGVNLPYLFLTCSANTEIFDLLGTILPNMDDDATVAVMKEMELPTLDDIRMDPATAYSQMTGEYEDDVTEDQVVAQMVKLVAERLNESPKDSSRFTYVESPLVQAMRNGYLVEIQEPTVIANPGVLVGLNSLLDDCSSVTLPNGKRVERHPETIVVVTTNTSYAGCKDINQSVISRMNVILDIGNPDVSTTVERVMGITGCTDTTTVTKMAEVVRDMERRRKETMITDGSCGVRELICWVQSFMITADAYRSALITVISSSSGEEENREELISTCLEPVFSPK